MVNKIFKYQILKIVQLLFRMTYHKKSLIKIQSRVKKKYKLIKAKKNKNNISLFIIVISGFQYFNQHHIRKNINDVVLCV